MISHIAEISPIAHDIATGCGNCHSKALMGPSMENDALKIAEDLR